MNQTTIADLLTLLDDVDTKFSQTHVSTLETPFDISPAEFIKYAEFDLTSSYDHKAVNALSNAKRAMDGQLDSLLLSFGYYKTSQKGYWGFPKKIDLVKELGIIAPRILNKVNKQRNLLEHQFIKPELTIVEDFLDIAMLFVASTDRYTLRFVNRIMRNNKSLKKGIVIDNDYKAELLVVKIYKFENEAFFYDKADNLISTEEYPVKHPDYKILLKKYLELGY
ncbi:hypothetical protein [Mucilaginibacter sp. OK098]|uniref:hypothetical protein n=1 Tax=Mucilaginibacter sp. OK098 TaxID=1855297 RepID=UPI00091AEE5D|nr:hypothetical protein [Mucilaginibacter sp. OK098]SHL96316.1 hypothetical protein SAMN05216524_101337 [Mucilaginibacter sp. OK098]